MVTGTITGAHESVARVDTPARRLPKGASPVRSRSIALWAAIAGFGLLAISEVLSGAIGAESTDSAAAGWVGSLFGIASLLVAAGTIVAGVVIVRAKVWEGLGRWMVLASGIVLLVLVTPSNIVGDPMFRNISLILWTLTLIPLGQTVVRSARSPQA